VLGGTEPWPALWTPEADELPPGLSVAYLLGAEAYDLTSYSMEARDYDNDGYADIFPNAMWGDGRMNQSDAAGEAYLVSGYLLVEATLGVDRVDPPQGSGVKQTTVEVIGSGFTTSADTRVFIGDMPAISVQVLTCERLLAEVAPPATRLLEPVDVRVVTRYGDAVLTDGFTFTYPEAFVRGDPNLDLIINITDPIFLLSSLFFSKEGLECRDAADANDDGSLDVSDALRMLNYLFLNGPPPAAPFPEAGFDTTIDDLGCR
jgi:hypothetical protein